MPTRLLIDPDFAADDCLWDTNGTGVDVDSVPMSPSTREKLRAWQRRWDVMAKQDLEAEAIAQGKASGSIEPVSAKEWNEHERDGRSIWLELNRDLGPQWQVGWLHYVSDVRSVQWGPDSPIEAFEYRAGPPVSRRGWKARRPANGPQRR
jgi:hypothetical protein